MLSRGRASDVPVRASLAWNSPSDVRHPQLAARRRSSSSHTPQAWLSHSSTSVLMNVRKKPSMSGSRTSRSSASCTASLWIGAMQSRAAFRVQGRGQLAFQLISRACASPGRPLGTVEHAPDYAAESAAGVDWAVDRVAVSYQRTMSERSSAAWPEGPSKLRHSRPIFASALCRIVCSPAWRATMLVPCRLTFRLASPRSCSLLLLTIVAVRAARRPGGAARRPRR